MKKIFLETLLRSKNDLTYLQQYEYVLKLLDEKKIKPVKASGLNGKKPALYREYWILEEKKDHTALKEELKYRLSPLISVDYYLTHPAVYEKDRKWVLMLSDYLKKDIYKLQHAESLNERSFEIWNREKFLSREQGKRILKCCGLEMGFLHIYETTEPLAYYSHIRETPQKLLILENKDPFYSMRRHLLEGKTKIFGESVGTLIYGAGKGILRSFMDFDLCAEPYMKMKENKIYYFGDLDYEGIGIYENLAEMFWEKREIYPFVPAYEAMIKKSIMISRLPETKEQQNRNIHSRFFSYFEKETVERMKQILETDRYIPQEILNIRDF